MFTALIWAVFVIVAAAMFFAYSESHDVFHPIMFIGPMMIFMYGWMPLKLDSIGGLDGFLQQDQLEHVQLINVLGVTSFICGCLGKGAKLPSFRRLAANASPGVLSFWGTILGLLGIGAWSITIINVGGIQNAFGTAYSGGWDDNGYVRDAVLLIFPGFLMLLAAGFQEGGKLNFPLMVAILSPWAIQAAFTARRGPTFMLAVTLALGWYLNSNRRPSLPITITVGSLLGLLMLFLVTNRSKIYLGSDEQLSTEISSIVEKPDPGNEYIYGAGAILSSEQRETFYWGRRYLAQIMVRPVPRSIWPTKYEDFGLPEMMRNAGTGEGFKETLGWEGAEGSAPGIISDLWIELWWLNMPFLFVLGRLYAVAWQRATILGGVWIPQYTIMAALSIYLVMQTMEAVIFRVLILSLPLRWIWSFAERQATPEMSPLWSQTVLNDS